MNVAPVMRRILSLGVSSKAALVVIALGMAGCASADGAGEQQSAVGGAAGSGHAGSSGVAGAVAGTAGVGGMAAGAVPSSAGVGGVGTPEVDGGAMPDVEPPTEKDSCGLAVSTEGGGITVENLTPGVTVPHQLVVLQGRTATEVPELSVRSNDSSLAFKTAGTDFKVTVLLKPGLNHVGIEAPNHKSLCFPISWQEPENDHTVRMVLFVAQDSDEQTFVRVPGSGFDDERQCLPDELCDNETVAKRVEFIGLQHQLAMAELLVLAGMPRKTFSLKRDANGELVTAVFRSERTLAELLDAARADGDPENQREWYALDSAEAEITQFERDQGRDPELTKLIIVFADFQSGAWGGAPIGASFGGGEFYSWPADVPQLMERLYDERELAPLNLEEDGGPTVRRTYATTVGASLHELGHTFGFDHVDDTACEIMNRGFDVYDSLFRPDLALDMCWTRRNNQTPDGDDHAAILDSSPWIQ